MAAYFMFDVREIKDAEKISRYRDQVFATVEQFDGRYLALGGPFEIIEGDWTPSIPVIIEFPSIERRVSGTDRRSTIHCASCARRLPISARS